MRWYLLWRTVHPKTPSPARTLGRNASQHWTEASAYAKTADDQVYVRDLLPNVAMPVMTMVAPWIRPAPPVLAMALPSMKVVCRAVMSMNGVYSGLGDKHADEGFCCGMCELQSSTSYETKVHEAHASVTR